MRYQINSFDLLEILLSEPPYADECWVWPRYRNEPGYGVIHGTFKGISKAWFVHRLAYELKVHPVPEEIRILHRCDNPPCFRPSHLFHGTDGDNVRDCISKGRFKAPRGQDSGQHKLTTEQVLEILQRAEAGIPRRDLSSAFGVSKTTIQNIVTRTKWKHLCP